MKAQYAQAFLDVLKDGLPVETAITGLRTALAKKNHDKLLGSVLLEAVKTLEANKGVKQVIVKTAKSADVATLATQIKTAFLELGVEDGVPTKTIVDETLIGGFVATFDYQEYDRSYKKSLKNLYESIVN